MRLPATPHFSQVQRVHGIRPAGRRKPGPMPLNRWVASAVLVICLGAACPALAAPRVEPSPACTSPVWPASAHLGSPPNVAEWPLYQPPLDWDLQPCLGWELRRFTSFVAVVGTFRAAGMDAVLSRLGAVSTLKDIRYWSVTDRRLEPLIFDAFALEAPVLRGGRADFTPQEMQTGRDLFFTQHDNRSSAPVRYRMRVVERRSDSLVVDIANENRVRLFLLTLFEPGDVRTALFITRTANDTWTCYALAGSHPSAVAGLLDNRKSHVNRLIAFYGYLTGSDGRDLPWAK